MNGPKRMKASPTKQRVEQLLGVRLIDTSVEKEEEKRRGEITVVEMAAPSSTHKMELQRKKRIEEIENMMKDEKKHTSVDDGGAPDEFIHERRSSLKLSSFPSSRRGVKELQRGRGRRQRSESI